MKTPLLFIHQEKHIGGGQTYVDGLRKGFSDLGIKTGLISGDNSYYLITKILGSAAETIIWSVYDRFPLLPYIISYLSGKKNIFIVYGIWKYESRALFDDFKDAEKIQQQKIREFKYTLRQFIFILLSHRIVHLSRYAKRLFNTVPLFRFFKNKKNVIIYGGADTNKFTFVSPRERQNLRSKIGIGKNDVILLMAGRIEKRKNYTEGVKILKEVRRILKNKHVFLFIVFSHGSFNDYKYLDTFFDTLKQENTGEYIKIISGIDTDKIDLFYKVSDIYLMLSRELETFGLVTLEALNSGLPVFGYDACATPEILSNAKSTALFRSGDTKSVSLAITRYLNKSDKEKLKFVSLITENINNFSWKSSAGKIYSSLKEKD